jgi:hypothetical protein
MRIFIRYLLWILIAALPLQGSVAVAMQYSAGSVPGQPAPSSEVAAMAHADHHQADKLAAHCGQSDGDHAAAPHGKCSHCASCCVGAALPAAVAALVLPATFSTFAGPAAEPAMTAHIPATLERPPRRHS